MSRLFDRPISIQRINEATELWEDVFKVHASINKTKADNEYLNAGAIQAKKNLTFEVRYFADLEDISLNLQSYRIVYQGVPYNIEDYDDYMLKHKSVKILGVSY
jgi:SPP1 family predicted phage head-tail adaptor